MKEPEHVPSAPPPEVLTEPDHSGGVAMERPGSGIRSQISNAMVGLKKRYYGKGPEKAKTFINDNYVFCVLEGGLTRNEETLLAAGQATLVREYRLHFQAVMERTTTEALEAITGRKVLGYHSQIVFDPDRSFEIFVLDAPPEAV
ncbi:MAG TPA: DUF2294 domain-containing protein [Solirubrobacteraceae bacterium]|jgi:uncharacterized protein YbcI